MKFSEQWLRTMVDPSLSSEELSHLLTMAGLEVEELDPVAPEFNNVVVAEILSAEKHPDADHAARPGRSGRPRAVAYFLPQTKPACH